MRQIYVSGALTNGERKSFYEKIGKEISDNGWNPYIPHLHTDPKDNPDVTPEEVYEVDMKKIEESSYVVAYVGLPSLGVGAELEHANACGIPIILMYKKGERVSRLVQGIPKVCLTIVYENEEDGIHQLWKKLLRHIAF